MPDGLYGKLKILIAAAQARGYVTYDALNSAMPTTDYTSEQIEDVLTVLSERGIELVDM
jgi:RNA polymerase primary sigma factor